MGMDTKMTNRILAVIVAVLLLYTLAGIGYQIHLKTLAEARGLEMKKRMNETGGLYCGGNVEFC